MLVHCANDMNALQLLDFQTFYSLTVANAQTELFLAIPIATVSADRAFQAAVDEPGLYGMNAFS